MKDVLCVILGGGRGARLYPLTKYRAKPAVPLAGKYRLIDIPISNSLNSDIKKIAILTQFNSESLNKHIFRAYKLDSYSGGFVEIIAAEQSIEESNWFQGSADAVRKCLKHFNDPRIKRILILSGDQLYKMNFHELLDFHDAKKAEITIACNAVDKDELSSFGITVIDENSRIRKFIEKPNLDQNTEALAINKGFDNKFLASMGIYVFNKEILFDLLKDNSKMDFGKEIIPDASISRKTYGFVYSGYWKDIGSIKSFYEENLAFTGPHPQLDLFDEDWQFYTRPRYLPLTKIQNGQIENSNIAEGAIIEDARIIHSIIGLRSKIGSGTTIEDSVLMGNDFYENTHNNSNRMKESEPKIGIGKNCHIKKAIVDKNVRICDNVKIINKKNIVDFENEYCVIRNGITVIPKNTIIPPNTII